MTAHAHACPGSPGHRVERLAAPWTQDTATDLLYGLISTDLMVRLLEDRGWSHAQIAEGLSSLLRSTLATD